MTEELSLLASDSLAGTEMPDDAIRADLVDKTLQSLLEDAARCEGELARTDINRAYFRRKLTISECAEVERQIRDKPVNILESDDDDEEEDSDQFVRVNSIPLPKRTFLNEAVELTLGRKIQFAKRMNAQVTPVDADFWKRVNKEAAEAKTQFVESNLRYVWKLAGQKAKGLHLTREDLFQEGMIGLLKGVDMYDPELGFRFKTYATWWVLQGMHRAKDNGDRTVRIPVHLKTKLNRIRRAQSKLAEEIGRQPNCARAMIISTTWIQRAAVFVSN